MPGDTTVHRFRTADPTTSTLIDRLIQTWEAGSPVPLAALLPPEPAASVVADVACQELQLKLRAGQAVRVADYLAAYPQVAASDELVLYLLEAEVLGRKAHGPPPALDEYVREFPHLRIELERLFGVPGPPLPESPAGYELLGEIGRGGMGVIYRARDLALKREVAIKVLQPRFVPGSTIGRRFVEEAQITGQLQHPGIPAIHQVGTLSDGRPFLAMRLIKGQSLASLINSWSEINTLGVFEAICQAVGYAHERGVIHRDLKPDNVMVGAFGEVQVMDWGLAKVLSDLATPDTETMPNATTTPATVIHDPRTPDRQDTTGAAGTPWYMSPEQAAGEWEKIGPRTDVFGVGGILCALLTGKPPIDGATPKAALTNAIRGETAAALARLTGCGAEPELVALCRRCLSVNPADRPADAGEVAEAVAKLRTEAEERAKRAELEKAQAEVRTEVRAAEGRKRRQVWAVVVLLSLLLLFVLGAGWVVSQERVADVRVAAQVDRLRTAAAPDVANLRADLTADRPRAEPLVRELLARAQADGDTKAEFNARLVLVAWDESHTPPLIDRALVGTPDEVLAVRDAVGGRMAAVQPPLRDRVADPQLPLAKRLRALALLGGEADQITPAAAAEIAPQLLAEDRLQLSAWVRALEPVKSTLVDPLAAVYAQQPDADAGVAAALVLREFLRGDHRRVVPLVARGGPRQAYLLGEAMRGDPDGVKGLMAEWERLDPSIPDNGYTTNREEGGNAEATRRTKYGLALLAIGRGEAVWPALTHTDEPQLRTNLIHAFAPAGVPPQALEPAHAIPDPAVRQAVYLAWGEYPSDRWGAAEFNRWATVVADGFATHPDPGVHSAAEWLLRRWKQDDRLAAARKTLPTEGARKERNWFVNTQGTTFAVVPGPVTTRLGGFYEWAHASSPVAGPEFPHRRRIGRSFALATTEVTVAQFKRFYEAHRTLFSPDFTFHGWANRSDDCPVGTLDWYTAARFCRWLGDEEKLTEAQQPYPKVEDIKPGMKLPADFLDRPGYRLPTEAEWEYACRGPSRTLFGFGSDRESLSQYAWWLRNAGDQMHPVGRLKPSPLGLFDIHGNAFEWCGHRAAIYPPIGQLIPVLDDTCDGDECQPENLTVLRGGDFPTNEDRQRTAHRTRVPRSHSWPSSGLRLCRTLVVPRLDVYRAEGEETRSTYAVRGPAGKYRVTVVRGDVAITAAEGDIPGKFEVVANGGRAGAFTIVVERAGSGEKQTIGGEFTPAEWTVRWMAWKPNPVHHLAEVMGKDWDEAVNAPPLRTATATRPIVLWGDKPPAASVPENFNGFVATATVAVAGGRYRLSGVNTVGGFRVTVDGKVVLSYRWPGWVDRETQVIDLPAGKHEFKVEGYHIVGTEMFDLDLQPEPEPAQTR